MIEQPVRGFGGQPFADAEYFVERVIEPDARRCSAEKRVVAGEGMPDLARIPFDRSTVMPRDTETLEAHTLAVEHPEHIMIRCDEQRGCIAERRVVREPLRIGMAMRAHDRQILDRRVERAGERTLAGFGREEAIGLEL